MDLVFKIFIWLRENILINYCILNYEHFTVIHISTVNRIRYLLELLNEKKIAFAFQKTREMYYGTSTVRCTS